MLLSNSRKKRFYEIEAIEVPIVYNKYGDHDQNGLIYVLKKDAEHVRKCAMQNFEQEIPQPCDEVKPLVIRANKGDTVVVNFSHSLDRPLSIHVQGMAYDVQTSGGASVGFNKDSTTRHRITYTWYAKREGVYIFHDMADPASSEDSTNIHGLFGAIIVEAPQSRWLNPENGKELESGLFADIYHPTRPAFREYAVFFHDELEIKDKDGNQPMDHHTHLPSATTGISYRSEPMRNRLPLSHDPADSAEDISMSSWVYGDPAPPILKAYVGDPSKIRLIHGGIKETHVFHLHNHQWRLEGDNQNSTIIDSISISPQECYTLDILHGAGSLNGMIGDAIFHCHLYPHFHEGMWTLWRIYDRLEDGTGRLPDGTVIPPLLPLKDRKAPPKKDKRHPGYPNFINGTFGEAPLQPPLGILDANGENKIEPTGLERENFVKNFELGALYTDTCPCHTDKKHDDPCHEDEKHDCPHYADEKHNCSPLTDEKHCCPHDTDTPVKVFEIAVVQAKLTYNRYGWHDPQGRFFVLKEELERHGDHDPDGLMFIPLEDLDRCKHEGYKPKPLILRANAGEWIEVTLHNLFNPKKPVPYFDYPKVPLDMKHKPSMRVSLNPQFLHYDPVCDSGINVGYNNREQTVGVGESKKYLWFADQEYGACILQSFGDMRNHRYHGLFGAILIEPPGAKWYKNCSLTKAAFEEEAVITAPGTDPFRECVVLIQNGIRMLDKDGELIKTATDDGEEVDDEDTGEKGYNYRSERFANRLKKDKRRSKVFSSRVHGDPATPVFTAYPGERVIFRTMMPADKPRNVGFTIHDHEWRQQPDDPLSRIIPLQGAVSIGDTFDMELMDGSACPGDYLYRSGSLRWDVESGMWGIFRVMRNSFGHKCKNACRKLFERICG
ncbi:MAG: multicopper oxidase domain-containing protein [Lachnospiraceae bacterium]|nr:multicopper oxidase domain-containing protein [bacterium]MDY5518150.1 multicopper oxidase domain-containing protein [Lachnospiraceae bacterium]